MNIKIKNKFKIILMLLILIIAIIGVITYKEATQIKKIAQNNNIELKEQTEWNNETEGLGIEVTQGDITTKEITVKVTKAEIEKESEEDLEYRYYIKETNKVDYEETANHIGTEKSYTYGNLEAGKNYDIKVELTNTNTKKEITAEIKEIKTKEVPNAQEEIEKGTITVSEPTWSNERASITIKTTTGLKIEYQVNTATEGGWTEGKEINNLKAGDIVRIRLTDGKNKGNIGSITIGEEQEEVRIETKEITEESITVEVASNNKEYREETSPEYSYYIKGTEEAKYTSKAVNTEEKSYTFKGLEPGKKYDIKVVLTNKAGNVIEGEKKGNTTTEEIIGIYVTLYTDGTLGFSNNSEPMAGKTIQKEYGNIKGQEYIRGSQPWSKETGNILRITFNNEIKPTSTAYWFVDCRNITEITNINNLNTSQVTNMESMFSSCNSLTSLDLSNFDTSQVTNMSWMINCDNLTNVNVSNFDTSKVTDMSGMFGFCSKLTNLDLSNFNTSNVTNMSRMFRNCDNLININVSSFDTSKVTDMSGMFTQCFNLNSLNLNNFNTSKVTDMASMFFRCDNITNLNVSSFNTSQVINMDYMFYGCSKLTNLEVSNFNTEKATSMQAMFSFCSSLKEIDVSNFNTSQVTNMAEMFSYCESITSLDVSNFNTSQVTNMAVMFNSCKNLTSIYVSNFETEKVTSMKHMFYDCEKLTSIDISNFNTSNVENIRAMFSSCNELTTIYASDKFITTKVTDSTNMFGSSTKLVGGNGTKYSSSYIDKTYARIDKPGRPGYFTLKSEEIITGEITVNSITWNNEKAKITLETTTELTIQYKIGEEGNWTTGNTVTNLNHGDIVYVRLTDGNKYSAETTINILDQNKPTASIQITNTNVKPGETVTATVVQIDYESGINITECKFVYNTIATNMGETSTQWNTATSIENNSISFIPTNAGTYYLHVLTIDKAGNRKETISQEIIVEANNTEVFAEDIGKKVDYVAKDYTDLTWRIFYYDETYVYLISEKTADGSNPVASCNLSDKISGKYTNGSDEIDSNLRFLNQQWYTQLNGSKSTTDNAKAVAYLMDQSVWEGYKDSEGKAAYSIGGPTLELFKNSYNKSEETTNTIELTCTSTGYDQNTSINWLLETYNNGIYNNGSSSNWWLASSVSSGSYSVFSVEGRRGFLGIYSVGNSFGLRPIVLIPKTNFQYNIIPEM